jgi:parallel beta-helix repeat protein
MKKIIFQKIFAIFLIILFCGMNGAYSIDAVTHKPSASSFNGDILYVGGSGPGNYSKIKSAYDDAKSGDTIFVFSGTYYEFLHIKKTINLIGEDKDTTSIIYNTKEDGPIIIEAPYVKISGFTVYNPNPNLVCYIEILYENNHHVSISDCIFYNNPLHIDDGSVGINVVYSSYNTISNCTFLYNDDEGICLNFKSNHNIVENCYFSNCQLGIEFQNSSYNTIDNCIMKDCSDGIGITVKGYTSNNNIIKNCNIYNNYQSGIYLFDTYGNVIYNCYLNKNLDSGISIGGQYSYNNLIVDNEISNSTMCSWGGGLQLGWSCHNNTFSNNHISDCNNGVYIEDTFDTDDCNDNLFYHNNFVDNTQGAFDECDNLWDNGYPSGGNFWSDYTGVDNNDDGIGDTPYDLSGGENKDYYPLMEPWIADEPIPEAHGPYYGVIDAPTQFKGVAVGGYQPYTWYWDFGDGNSSDEMNPAYNYTKTGKYDVVLTVTDSHNSSSSDTTFAWIQETNDPPNKPTITGETNGKIGVEYDYTFEINDTDGNHVWLMINWGDGTSSNGWIGPYTSGQQLTFGHTWLMEYTFTIKAKAKDPYNAESEWAELVVKVPRNKIIKDTIFLQLLEKFPLINKLFERLVIR